MASNEVRNELATLIDEAIEYRVWVCVADALLAEGYVRVIEDGATVERVQSAIVGAHNEFQVDGEIPHWGRHLARAAIRALRGEPS